ncbi:MAG: TolC family protein [Bacteroidetes bacterium]|nr:TolC family protein [Bacteroidota bacterium]
MAKNRIAAVLLFIMQAFMSLAQESILDEYISEGLANNLEIKQKQLSWEKSRWALKEARGLFMPGLSFNARYTLAHGGRTIDIPVGDMMNDVYHTLYLITEKMNEYGLADQVFPDTSLENQSVKFLRDHEQETKLQLVQPLFNTQIFYNYKVRKEMIAAEEEGIDNIRRNLVAEIKKTYYSYLMTKQLTDLIERTITELDQVVEINNSLYKNDKLTIDVIYTLKAEQDNLRQQKKTAEKMGNTASAYLNFLLNRPLDTPVKVSEVYSLPVINISAVEAGSSALQNREELSMLKVKESIENLVVKLNRYDVLPEIFAVIDYGFQGEEYKFTDQDDYMLASFILKWDLFRGFQNRAAVQQAILDMEMTSRKIAEVKNRIALQVNHAYNDMDAAFQSVPVASARFSNSSGAYTLVKKRYEQDRTDLNFFSRFMDALTSKASAERNLIETRFDFYIKYAELERVAALYELPEMSAMPDAHENYYKSDI